MSEKTLPGNALLPGIDNMYAMQQVKHILQRFNSVKTSIIIGLLLLLLLLSLLLFTLLRLYPEIRDIWRPEDGLAGTRDSMAQIRDSPENPRPVATLTAVSSTCRTACQSCCVVSSWWNMINRTRLVIMRLKWWTMDLRGSVAQHVNKEQ